MNLICGLTAGLHTPNTGRKCILEMCIKHPATSSTCWDDYNENDDVHKKSGIGNVALSGVSNRLQNHLMGLGKQVAQLQKRDSSITVAFY